MHIAVPRVHVYVCALVRCRLVTVTMQPAGHPGWPGVVRTSYAMFRVLHAEKKTGKLASYPLNVWVRGEEGAIHSTKSPRNAHHPQPAFDTHYTTHHHSPPPTTSFLVCTTLIPPPALHYSRCTTAWNSPPQQWQHPPPYPPPQQKQHKQHRSTSHQTPAKSSHQTPAKSSH